ncbi:FecR family protein [Chitinophaga sp. Hz27]|uniref:FecR family protein n=1 Tax=Chitinophaga sp. Hz27 TaxID=3347169 RepID=UPI0035D5961C
MATPDYYNYNASQLALDQDFQDWILQPERHNVFWENWLLQYPEKEPVIDAARKLVNSVQFKAYVLPEADKELLLDAIWHKMEEQPDIRNNRHYLPWKYAAAVLAGIVITAAFMLTRTTKQPVMLSARTLPGEKKTWLLPDSSEVVLNADSRLLFTTSPGKGREVWLDGEAYFHVKHKTNSERFIVHTYEHFNVEVTGTQFNVNSKGPDVIVVLEKGSIRLHINESVPGKSASMALVPGEMVRYNKVAGDYAKSKTDPAKFTAWHNGKLIMEDYTLQDAATFMQQTFGCNLIINDTTLLKYKVSGSMPVVYNVDTMMLQLANVFRIQFNQKGNDIWIQKK